MDKKCKARIQSLSGTARKLRANVSKSGLSKFKIIRKNQRQISQTLKVCEGRPKAPKP
jgi:hypothetical protein